MKFLISLIFCLNAYGYGDYPSEWWAPFPEDQAESWEVLPQDANEGEVVASKRTALGVFSNLWETPFLYEGVQYASIEGLWQMMKYPEEDDPQDPRHAIAGWPHTRTEVQSLSMWESKDAGDIANKLNKENGINWVTYQGETFNYKDMAEGSKRHYEIIYSAMVEKVLQNENVRDILIKTKGLRIIADHRQGSSSPASYYYCDILMKIRAQL